MLNRIAQQTFIGLLIAVVLFATCGYEHVSYCCGVCEKEGLSSVVEGKCCEAHDVSCCRAYMAHLSCEEPGCDTSVLFCLEDVSHCRAWFVKADLESVEQRSSSWDKVVVFFSAAVLPTVCHSEAPIETRTLFVGPDSPISQPGGRTLLSRISLLLI